MATDDHTLDSTGKESAGSSSTLPLLGDFGSEADVDEFDVGYDGAAEGKQLAQQSALLIGLVVVLAVGMLASMQVLGSSDGATTPATEIASIEDFIRKSQNPGLVASEDPQHPDRLRAMFSDADHIVEKISNTFPEKRVQLAETAKNPFSRPQTKTIAAPDVDLAEKRRQQQITQLSGEAGRLNLQSIMGSGDRSVAVINGDFYRQGQAIGAFRVTGIDNGRVSLEPMAIESRNDDPVFELSIEAEVSRVPLQRF